MCRNCTNHSQWRCDSGWCISKTKVRDGVPNCPNDLSDESYGKPWFILILLSSKNKLSSNCTKGFLNYISILLFLFLASITIWNVIVITIAISVIGMLFPFLCRFVHRQCKVNNFKNIFYNKTNNY